MEIKVTKNEVKINKDILNDGEYNIHKCQFDFGEEYNGLVQKAVFTLNDGSSYLETIVDDECNIPIEVLNEGILKIGVYAYETNNDELVLRYSPSPDIIHVFDGSYVKDAQNSEGGTPTEYEQLESRVNDELNEMNALADDLEEKVESGYFKGDKGEKGDPGAIKMIIVNELPATGEDDTIYLVPLENPSETGNNYAEYVYINGAWELLGKIGVHVDLSDYYTKQETNTLLDSKADVEDIPDLTDYVKNTDYANVNTGGVIKTAPIYGTMTRGDGYIIAVNRTYQQYLNDNDGLIVGKITLENVITGKGLVSDTDYATDNKGGVFKTSETYNLTRDGNGALKASINTYNTYLNKGNNAFIGKGTLENVLNARIGDIDTLLDTINGEVI